MGRVQESSLVLVCFATLWSPQHNLQVDGLNDPLGPSPAVTSEDSVNNQCYKELSGGLWRTLEGVFWEVLCQSVILPLKPTLVLAVSCSVMPQSMLSPEPEIWDLSKPCSWSAPSKSFISLSPKYLLKLPAVFPIAELRPFSHALGQPQQTGLSVPIGCPLQCLPSS